MTTPPWVSISKDDNGIPVVTVKEGDLDSIPKFLHYILKNKVGMEEGVFKVCFLEGVHSLTSLHELLSFVRQHFSKKVKYGKKWEVRKILQQTFTHGSPSDHIYGYDKTFSTNEDQNDFLQTLQDPQLFSNNESSCCLQALSESENRLHGHYWNIILNHSSESIQMECMPEVNERSLTDARLKYCYNEESCTESVSHPPANLLQRDSGVVTRSILYADGIPVGKNKFNITPKFSLSDFKTIIDVHPQELPGLSFPYLYVGMSHATFPWHIEDTALFSLNYLHFGAPCVWYVVPPSHYKRFVELIQYLPLDLDHVKCTNILGHKYLVASPDFLKKFNVATHTVVQKAEEVVITYPFAAHMGYKTGRNLSEAINFGDPWWVEPAILAPTCECFPYQINMDLKEIIAVSRPHLYQMYIKRDMHGLFMALRENEFVTKLGLLPVTINVNSTIDSQDTMASCAKPVKQQPKGKPCKKREFKGARCLLLCPEEDCKVTFKGGRSKLYRVENHINAFHQGSQDLINKLHSMYPAKQYNSRELICPLCQKIYHGDAFNLKLHMARVH